MRSRGFRKSHNRDLSRAAAAPSRAPATLLVRLFRISFLSTALAVAMLVPGHTALANTELGHSGTVGVHSLTDTSTTPGATCKYKFLAEWGFGKLKKIVVRPPNVRAVAGKEAQKVGWQFTVQRKTASFGGASSWTNRYTSPEMTAVTDDTHNAAFTKASVRVRVPFGPGEDISAIYRVKVKMIWHRQDDSIQGIARHRVDFYRSVDDIGSSEIDPAIHVCGDYWSPGLSSD